MTIGTLVEYIDKNETFMSSSYILLIYLRHNRITTMLIEKKTLLILKKAI